MQCEKEVLAMFDASISVHPGDGKLIWFWSERWPNNASIENMAPDLYRAVAASAKHSRTLQQGLQNRQWIRDIVGPITVVVLVQYLKVWELIQEVTVRPEQEDKICWRWTNSGQYTAKSAYEMFFCGSTLFTGAKLIWKA
ncbi:hypothetical protein PR202_ga16553 [Eleusine coracana subsp. coracana]|uniref:Uncharacterized protein n=1 Tax=Eleusine coracana subsp. coracana TaxID=191504 RepID=A0AAV5CMT2_ELECO|nr:hypothetical protein PR202_ga16553 [Eleusine coracana subsp. coracana]